MEDPWFFEYESVEGKKLTVEASSPTDIWVWHKNSAVVWNSLLQDDKDEIKDRVEQHFFMEEATKSWSQR